MLFLVKNLVEGVHGEEGDPGDAELLDDGVGHGGLATRASATDADNERLNQLTLPIVPWRSSGGVDRPPAVEDDGRPLRALGGRS